MVHPRYAALLRAHYLWPAPSRSQSKLIVARMSLIPTCTDDWVCARMHPAFYAVQSDASTAHNSGTELQSVGPRLIERRANSLQLQIFAYHVAIAYGF